MGLTIATCVEFVNRDGGGWRGGWVSKEGERSRDIVHIQEWGGSLLGENGNVLLVDGWYLLYCSYDMIHGT